MLFLIFLLVCLVAFSIGLFGEIKILRLRASTSLQYDDDFALIARLALTIFVILIGIISMMWTPWTALASVAGVGGIYLGEKIFEQIKKEQQKINQEKYLNEMEEIDNSIDEYF